MLGDVHKAYEAYDEFGDPVRVAFQARRSALTLRGSYSRGDGSHCLPVGQIALTSETCKRLQCLEVPSLTNAYSVYKLYVW